MVPTYTSRVPSGEITTLLTVGMARGTSDTFVSQIRFKPQDWLHGRGRRIAPRRPQRHGRHERKQSCGCPAKDAGPRSRGDCRPVIE